MNLHAIVSPAIAAVNPFIVADLLISTGAGETDDGTANPTYAPPVTGAVQVQALSGRDLRQLESLNIQGIERKAYFNGNVQGLDRPAGKGGDLIKFNSGATVPAHLRGTTWLVGVVFETWDSDGWCSVGLVKQLDEG